MRNFVQVKTVRRLFAPFPAMLIFAFSFLLTIGTSLAALQGSYSVGTGSDFATLRTAVDSLVSQGIAGNVKFSVAPGAYLGPISIGSFAGAGQYDVSIIPATLGTIVLTAMDTTQPVCTIDGAQRVYLQNFSIRSDASTQPALRITNGARDVTVNRCDLFGHGTGTVVELSGSTTSNIVISDCQIRRGGDGVSMIATGNSAVNNRISHCVIDSVQRGVFVSKQTNCLIELSEIKPNWGTGNGAVAINVGTQNPGDSVRILRNQISEIRTASGYAVAIRHSPQVGSARLVVANNFIYGFQNTGSSQIRALFLSAGDNRIVNNSILANDVTATGTSYSVYDGLTAADSRLTLLNNILVNLEATRPAYNLFVLTPAGGILSDHNIFHGTGAAYQLGWQLNSFASLSAWRSGTGLDPSSKSGDPQFVSNQDLHLQPTASLAHQNGAVVQDVAFDIDGAARFQPPDLGADEYNFNAPPLDAAVVSVLGLPAGVPAYSLVTSYVVVQNRGSLALSDLPLRLSFADTLRAEVRIALQPSAADTFLLVWSTTAANPGADIVIEALLASDANPDDNSQSISLAITDQPLAGAYAISPSSGDYASVGAALADLSLRGLSGAVTLELESGTYTEAVQINFIPGLSALNTLTIRPSASTEGLIEFAPTGSAQAFRLTGVSHVTLDGLVMRGNSVMPELLRIENGSTNNAIRNCRFIGAALDQTDASGIAILGGNCHSNLIEDCEIAGSYYGLRMEGNSLARDSSNVVRRCSIANVRTGLFAMWEKQLRVEECGISPGYPAAPAPCYAVRIGAQVAGDSVTLSNSRLFGGEAAGAIFGISNEANGGAVLLVNNWIGGFAPSTTGDVTSINCLSGETILWHNSVEIGETDAPTHAVAVSVVGAQTVLRMCNNIFRVARADGLAKMIEWDGGVIDANYNLYESPGNNPEFRFAANSLDETYQTLAAWTSATLQDSNSVSTAAGFISTNDLHIRPDAAGASNRGVLLPQVSRDADGDPRGPVPDLGADEYSYQAAITDVSAEELEVPAMPLLSGNSYLVSSVVRNVGQLAAPNVLVELLFNGVTVDTQLVSLATGDYRELSWNWTAPLTQFAYGTLALRAMTSGDLVPSNDLLNRTLIVAGTPLQGIVTLGGESPDFGTLDDLVEQLKWRGIASQLNVRIAPGNYTTPLVLDPIPGANLIHHVVFEPEIPGTVSFAASSSPATVQLRGAAFIELNGLSISCGSGTETALLLDPGSCNNLVENCTIAGAGAGNLNSRGVRFGGADCGANVISQCAVSSAFVGVALTGDDYNLPQGNVVRDNAISDVYYGVWVDHQIDAEVSGNEVLPGSQFGPANACYGVYVVQLGTGGSLRIEGNKIHGFLDSSGPRSNRAAGVYSAAGGNSAVEIVNNFIYGFDALTTLRVRAMYLSSGTHLVANNSIRIDDTPSNNETAGIFVSTGMEHQIYNNCVACYENDVPAYALDIESGAGVLSDYNCWWGNSSSFVVAQQGATNYSSITNWQAAGQDAHGISAHALYLSTIDLHMQSNDSTLFEAGVSLTEVPRDIDRELRPNPPCIGADEYTPQFILGMPQELTVSSVDGVNLILSWEPAQGARIYRIYSATSLDELLNNPLEIGNTANPQFTLPADDTAGGVRFFNVRAE